jgi:hypothetical protein
MADEDTAGATLVALTAALQEFISNNPASTVGQRLPTDTLCIINPWGDESLVISLSPANGLLIAALNRIIFPERYSAIWHIGAKRLEVIFTAYALSGSSADVIGRSFTFNHNGVEYHCAYDSASPELLLLADAFVPAGPANSSVYRNIGSFRVDIVAIGWPRVWKNEGCRRAHSRDC